MIQVRATIDDALTKDALRNARREYRGVVSRVMRETAERTTLPRARAPLGRWAGDLIVKSSARQAYLTGRTAKAGRIIGLLDFGGVVRSTITPKGKGKRKGHKGLKMPDGKVRANVTTPRVYRGRRYLEAAVAGTIEAYERELLTGLLHSFDPLEHSP